LENLMHRCYFPLGLAMLLAYPAHAQSLAPANHLTAPTSSAMAPPPVANRTLADAIALTLEHNKSLSAARREIDAMEATILQAGARPNPEISALMEDTKKATRTTTYQINQPIELGGKRSARIDAAQRARDIAVLAFAAKRSELRAGVTAAYFDTLLAQEKFRLAEELLTLAQRANSMTARRVSAGKISPVEASKAGVAQASARLALNQAASDLTLARKRLAAYWGEADSLVALSRDAVETPPPLPAIADLIERVNDGPAIQLAQLEVERRRALAKLESSKRIPDMNLSLGNKRDEDARRNMWVIGVSMPIPLFDSNRGNELEALIRVDQARDEQAATAIRIQGEAAQSYERMRNAGEESSTLQRDIVPAAESAYQAAAKGFELGKFSFLEVLDAQRTYFQVKSQYWQALSNMHQAAAELDRLAGPTRTDQE
jgi:cobalt-zinc-cadmium efflux system outer membrane protein